PVDDARRVDLPRRGRNPLAGRVRRSDRAQHALSIGLERRVAPMTAISRRSGSATSSPPDHSTVSSSREGFTDVAPAIELRGVSRIYGSGHTQVIALRPTHLLVHRGELVAVMGPSGSGMSTLLSLVGGLDRPTAARALV